jgi:hypothetical protein
MLSDRLARVFYRLGLERVPHLIGSTMFDGIGNGESHSPLRNRLLQDDVIDVDGSA